MQDKSFNNFKAAGLALLFCGVLLYSMPKILGGGFAGATQILIIFGPLFFALYLAARPIWPAILIGVLIYNEPFSRVPLFDKFSLGLIVSMIMVLFLMLEKAMHRRDPVLPGDPVKRAWTALAVIITARIIWDRPGSARMGSAGGMGEAILYLAGAWAFFASGWLGAQVENLKRQRKIILIIAVIAVVPILVNAVMSGVYMGGAMFMRQFWLLMACLFAASLGTSQMRGGRVNWFFIFSILSLVLGVLAEHRSRPAFALIMVLTAAALYKKFKKTALVVGVAGFVGLSALFAINPAALPVPVVRALSTIMPVDRSLYDELGETGWESKFREKMTAVGLENIKKSPLVGKGFSYSLADVLDRLSSEAINTGSGADVGVLSLAGGYHNTLLALSVSCGVFAGFFYVYCILFSIITFFKFIYRCQDPEMKMMGTILIVFFVPSCGQMLMNGHGYDLIVMAVLIGMMRGLQWQTKNSVSVKSASVQNSALSDSQAKSVWGRPSRDVSSRQMTVRGFGR